MAGCQLNVFVVPRGKAEGLEGDVFVSSIHRSKNMKRGQLVSYIRKKGGKEIQIALNEINPESELYHGQVVMTTSGRLTQFNHLMFICLYRWQTGNDEILQSSVFECLNRASCGPFETVILPALGTGGLRYPLREAAEAISNAILLFQRSIPFSSLKNIYICLQDELFSPQSEYVQTLKKCLGQAPEVRFSIEDSQSFSDLNKDAASHIPRAPDSECHHVLAQHSEHHRGRPKSLSLNRHRNNRQVVRYDRDRMVAASGRCKPWALRATSFHETPLGRLEGGLEMGRSSDGVHRLRAGASFKNLAQNTGGEVVAECAIM